MHTTQSCICPLQKDRCEKLAVDNAGWRWTPPMLRCQEESGKTKNLKNLICVVEH